MISAIPLSKEEGYAFLIKRTGSGRDTKYDVSPKRKVYKGDIEDKFWNTQHDLIAYANQADETRLLSTVRTMGRLIGIAAPTTAASAPAISSTAKTSAAALPGFGSVTGHTEGATAVATAHTQLLNQPVWLMKKSSVPLKLNLNQKQVPLPLPYQSKSLKQSQRHL